MTIIALASSLLGVGIVLVSINKKVSEKPESKQPVGSGVVKASMPLWDGKEARADYAKRVGLEPTLTLDLGGGVKLELVLIPAGKFTMGSPATEQERKDDETQHEVTITKPFYMGKYMVTQEQYEAITGKNPSNFKGAKNPVENVSWDDAQDVLSKAQPEERQNGALADGSRMGIRLPCRNKHEILFRR